MSTSLAHTAELEDSSHVLGSNKAWLVVFSASLFFFYEFIQMQMFNAINEALRVDFALDATKMGFLSSSYVWANTLFLLPAGIMLDRFSARKVIINALLLCILGTLGFALTHSYQWAAFYHFLSGIGNAFCFLSCIILVSRWFPANKQAMVIGLVVTLAFIGGMVAQTPLAWLSSHYGWRQALLMDTGLGFAILAMVMLYVVDAPQHLAAKHEGHKESFWHGFKRVLINKQNWLPGVYASCLNLPIMVLCALWGITYLQKVHHLTTMQASQVTSMIFIGSIIGCPIAGYISDKLNRRKLPMLIGGVLSLAAIAYILTAQQANFGSLLVSFFALGLFSSTQVIAYPMVTESNPSNLTGTATGLASVIIMGGAAVAQILFGRLLDWHWNGLMDAGQRVYSALNYQQAMQLFPWAFIIGLIALILANETLIKNEI